MLELKTRLSSIKLDENIAISKKGKYPLEIERKKLFIDYLSAQENSLYIVIGAYKSAYHVKIEVSLTKEMINEVLAWYREDKPLTDTTIRAQKITIKEIY